MAKTILQILIFCFTLLAFGCSENTHHSDKKATDIYLSKNVDSLAQHINLNRYRPDSVLWTIRKLGIANERVPGPTDYTLQAIMNFDKKDIQKIRHQYALLSTSFKQRDIHAYKFDWLPKNYIIEVDSSIDAVTYLPFFFQAEPLINGGFIINKNDILLQFYTQ